MVWQESRDVCNDCVVLTSCQAIVDSSAQAIASIAYGIDLGVSRSVNHGNWVVVLGDFPHVVDDRYVKFCVEFALFVGQVAPC